MPRRHGKTKRTTSRLPPKSQWVESWIEGQEIKFYRCILSQNYIAQCNKKIVKSDGRSAAFCPLFNPHFCSFSQKVSFMCNSQTKPPLLPPVVSWKRDCNFAWQNCQEQWRRETLLLDSGLDTNVFILTVGPKLPNQIQLGNFKLRCSQKENKPCF